MRLLPSGAASRAQQSEVICRESRRSTKVRFSHHGAKDLEPASLVLYCTCRRVSIGFCHQPPAFRRKKFTDSNCQGCLIDPSRSHRRSCRYGRANASEEGSPVTPSYTGVKQSRLQHIFTFAACSIIGICSSWNPLSETSSCYGKSPFVRSGR